MILTCPSCETRFMLPADALGDDGRKVKCSSCSHIWFQEPEMEEIEDLRENPAIDIPDAVKPIPEGSSVPVIPEDSMSRNNGFIASGAVCGVIFAVIGALLIALHPMIIKAMPATQSVYSVIGFADYNPSEGLVFDRIDLFLADDGDLSVISSVINLSNEDKILPSIRVSLHDSQGEEILSEIVSVPQKTIAGESITGFEHDIKNAPKNAQQVHVGFTLKGQAQNKGQKAEVKISEADDGNTHAPHVDETHHQNAHEADAGSHAPSSAVHH